MKDSREFIKKKCADISKMDIVLKDHNVLLSIIAMSQKELKYAKEACIAPFYNKTGVISITKGLEFKILKLARNIMDKEKNADSKKDVGTILPVLIIINSWIFSS